MIYDDQPQMVDAVSEHRISSGWSEQTRDAHSGSALKAAFAAIDREALIEKGVNAIVLDGTEGAFLLAKEQAERVLIVAGIIPERDDRHWTTRLAHQAGDD